MPVVVIELPRWDSPVITRPDRLRDSQGTCLPGAHATCPGHGAYFGPSADGHRPEYVSMNPG